MCSNNSGGCQYSQTICIIIEFKKHLSHSSAIFFLLNESFLIWGKKNQNYIWKCTHTIRLKQYLIFSLNDTREPVMSCSLQTVDGNILLNLSLPSQAFRWRSLASLSGCSAASFTVLIASTFASRSFLLPWTSPSLAYWEKIIKYNNLTYTQ